MKKTLFLFLCLGWMNLGLVAEDEGRDYTMDVPKLINVDEKQMIGVTVRTTNQEEMDPSTAKIPGLWQQFYTQQLEAKIPNKVEQGIVYGVYTNYESDHTGAYSLIVASEVDSSSDVPTGMVAVTIPVGKYLMFSVKGTMPEVVITLWKTIWDYFQNHREHERAYTTDFERYVSQAEVEIYIAVK